MPTCFEGLKSATETGGLSDLLGDQRFGTRGGPSICGSASRMICSSITFRSGVSDDHSKLSRHIPPRSFAARRTHATKLFETLG